MSKVNFSSAPDRRRVRHSLDSYVQAGRWAGAATYCTAQGIKVGSSGKTLYDSFGNRANISASMKPKYSEFLDWINAKPNRKKNYLKYVSGAQHTGTVPRPAVKEPEKPKTTGWDDLFTDEDYISNFE